MKDYKYTQLSVVEKKKKKMNKGLILHSRHNLLILHNTLISFIPAGLVQIIIDILS